MAKQNFTYEDVLNDLRQKIYFPVYFLMGEEPYYIDLVSDYIQNNILTETEKDFDQTIFYGKDVNIPTIINVAKRFPMVAKHQVLIVKEAQLIDADEWEKLSYYLKNPLKSTILVFCYKYGTPDKRKKWFQDISRAGVVFESKKLYENQVGPWIRSYLKSQNISITEKAINMLVEFLGNDLSKIMNALEKLLINRNENFKEITPELIEKYIGISKDYNVFELQSAIIDKNILKANRIIRYFGDNKKANPLPFVLIQLFNFFNNLLLYYYLKDKSEKTVALELKINPYFVKDYVKAASNFTPQKTIQIISDIRQTDARSKGVDQTTIEEVELLKELIFKILH